MDNIMILGLAAVHEKRRKTQKAKSVHHLAKLLFLYEECFGKSDHVRQHREEIPRSPSLDGRAQVSDQLNLSDSEIEFVTRLRADHFAVLVEEVTPLILTGRQVSFNLDDRAPRSRSAKLTPHQRLLLALKALREYRGAYFTQMEVGWSKTSINDDFHHVMRALARASDVKMLGAIEWLDDAEKEEMALKMTDGPFIGNIIALCDGTHNEVKLWKV
jgi:hypothetical protein